MGISAKKDDWPAPQRPNCACREHPEDVRALVIPNRYLNEGSTVDQLIATVVLGVRPLEAKERFWTALHEERNEFQVARFTGSCGPGTRSAAVMTMTPHCLSTAQSLLSLV
jgi:hypothetical protein